jgi:hypothetical protein
MGNGQHCSRQDVYALPGPQQAAPAGLGKPQSPHPKCVTLVGDGGANVPELRSTKHPNEDSTLTFDISEDSKFTASFHVRANTIDRKDKIRMCSPQTRKTILTPSRDLGGAATYKCSVRAAATAIAAEGMIRSVCGDHESAAYQGDEDLCCMRWKPISPICATENEN